MINGAHILFYSRKPDADRAFFRDVLAFKTIDIGHGWMIFALPPAEAAVHPADGDVSETGHLMLGAQVYLMCDDLQATVKELAAKNVQCGEIDEAQWGIRTTIMLPSGGAIGLYQPKHKTAI